eukprot:c13138_g1_i2.p1 GENE.c13138_g1_i2~~c13138_g1_i2.p1  ORF type:complete len:102 (-),score=33.37 c13138_g1_i2:48-329(-)
MDMCSADDPKIAPFGVLLIVFCVYIILNYIGIIFYNKIRFSNKKDIQLIFIQEQQHPKYFSLIHDYESDELSSTINEPAGLSKTCSQLKTYWI